MPFGLQPIHLVVIVLVALVVFGPKRLPQLGRWLGRTFSEFKRGARDMADGFKDETVKRSATGPESVGPGAGPAATGPETVGPRAGPGAAGPAIAETSPAQSTDRGQAEPARTSPYPETNAGSFCTRCGAANPADARYCNKCGIRLPV